MPQQAVLAVIQHMATQAERANAAVLRAVTAAARKTNEDNEAAWRRELRENLLERRLKAARVQLALRGVKELSAIGCTAHFHALVEALGKPLRFWGGELITCAGGDMSDIHWKWVSYIELTTSALNLYNYTATSNNYGESFSKEFAGSFVVTFPFAASDDFLNTRHLWRIATATEFEFLNEKDRSDPNLTHSTDRLFEILVECAVPKNLERYFNRSIS